MGEKKNQNKKNNKLARRRAVPERWDGGKYGKDLKNNNKIKKKMKSTSPGSPSPQSNYVQQRGGDERCATPHPSQPKPTALCRRRRPSTQPVCHHPMGTVTAPRCWCH